MKSGEIMVRFTPEQMDEIRATVDRKGWEKAERLEHDLAAALTRERRLLDVVKRARSLCETLLYTPPEAKHAREEMLLKVLVDGEGAQGDDGSEVPRHAGGAVIEKPSKIACDWAANILEHHAKVARVMNSDLIEVESGDPRGAELVKGVAGSAAEHFRSVATYLRSLHADRRGCGATGCPGGTVLYCKHAKYQVIEGMFLCDLGHDTAWVARDGCEDFDPTGTAHLCQCEGCRGERGGR